MPGKRGSPWDAIGNARADDDVLMGLDGDLDEDEFDADGEDLDDEDLEDDDPDDDDDDDDDDLIDLDDEFDEPEEDVRPQHPGKYED